MNCSSKWEGPYTFFRNESVPSIYESENADQPGVYLWTIPRGGEFWVNYIGIHRHSMLERSADHLRLFLGGRYTVYHSKNLIEGEKVVAFHGSANMKEFLDSYDKFHEEIINQLKIMRLFFAPFPKSDISELKRIESALIKSIRGDNSVRYFMDNERLSVNIPNNESDLEIEISSHVPIRGIGENFFA